MILNYLERLRKRPMAERRRFALLFAGSLTAIIAVLWGLTLPPRLSSLKLNLDSVAEEADQNFDASVGEAADEGGLQGFIDMQETFRGNPPEAAEEVPVEENFEVYAEPSSTSGIIIATSTEAR
jgi:hypothetical protein